MKILKIETSTNGYIQVDYYVFNNKFYLVNSFESEKLREKVLNCVQTNEQQFLETTFSIMTISLTGSNGFSSQSNVYVRIGD